MLFTKVRPYRRPSKTTFATVVRRHGKSIARHRGRELASLCVLRSLQARHIPVPRSLACPDRVGRCNGRRCQCCPRKSWYVLLDSRPSTVVVMCAPSYVVEMFKVRMQGQYGSASDKRLRDIAREMWKEWGFKRGVMRGYWVCTPGCRVSGSLASYGFVHRLP